MAGFQERHFDNRIEDKKENIVLQSLKRNIIR